MARKVLSFALIIALSLTMFTFVSVSADQSITLELRNEVSSNGTVQYSPDYSVNTLPGTTLNAKTVAELSGSQEVVYFLNGVEVGRANAAGNFDFTSVAGENNLQAKIMSGETVVAESNVIVLDFTRLYKGSVINSSPLSSADNCNFILLDNFVNSGWVSFDPDPANSSNGNVLHISNSDGNAAAITIPFAQIGVGNSVLDADVLRADFEFYGESYRGALRSAYIASTCGCNHSAVAYFDSGYGNYAPARGGSRSYSYPKDRWIKMSIVIDNVNKTYDLYADGIQLVSARSICVNSAHNAETAVPAYLYLPHPGWATTYAGGKEHGAFYLKDLSYYKMETGSITASVTETVVSGGKFAINASKKITPEMKYRYTVNGVPSELTDSSQYIGTARSGINTVVVEAIIDDDVVASSETITFNAYTDIFETALHRDGSTSTFALHNKNNPNHDEYKDFGVIGYENDATTFASDATHQSTLKISSGLAGQVGNEINVLTTYGIRKPNAPAMANASRLYAQSVDVYPENITTKSLSFRVYYPSSNSRESVIVNAFKFNEDTISVATDRAGSSFVEIPYIQDNWYTVKAIFDPMAGKIMLAVNDVVYSVIDESATKYAPLALNNDLANNYLYFDILLKGSGVETPNVVYLDNHDFTYSVLPYISVSTAAGTANVPCGMKVKVNAEHILASGKINYYCNGILVKGNTTDKEAHVTADAGVNEVYAELLDEYGTVVATSDEVTFNAYSDVFDKTVYNQSGSTSVLRRHGKHNDGVDDPYGVNVFENDSTTFAQDAKHGSVLKLASSVATTDKSPLINVLSSKRTYSELASAQRLYSMSFDIYPESVNQYGFTFANAIATKGATEKYLYFFKIVSGELLVSVNGSNFTDCIKIPCEDKWYNLKVVCDPMEDKYILAVDDVVYSIVDKTGTNDGPKFSNTGNLYYDMTLYGSKDAENPNVVYVDNFVVAYSTVPTHSPVKYTNGGSVVTNRSQISSENDLVINFVANKGEFNNVLCIATVLENNGELVCLDTQDVTFTEDVDSANVELTLTNLPASIAAGGYTVNVMLWDKVTNEPIVSKIVLAD